MGRACATMTAIPVVVGPTGIGKSQLAFELALRLDGEIVVADSRQVYQRLDIATNKPSDEQRRRVRYHMIDFVDPASDFNAAQYVVGARAAIDDITSRGKLPIVEGGTMLYVDAVCDGFSLTGIPPNPALRSELARLDVPSRRYARRQLRWWRRDERVRWFEIEPDPLAGILSYVENPPGPPALSPSGAQPLRPFAPPPHKWGGQGHLPINGEDKATSP